MKKEDILYTDKSNPKMEKKRKRDLLMDYIYIITAFSTFILIIFLPYTLIYADIFSLQFFVHLLGFLLLSIISIFIFYIFVIEKDMKIIDKGITLTKSKLILYDRDISINNIQQVHLEEYINKTYLEIKYLIENKTNTSKIQENETKDIKNLQKKLKEAKKKYDQKKNK